MQTESDQIKHLLNANSMAVSTIPPEIMPDKVSLEIVPSRKKTKNEASLSERSQTYGGWLRGELQEIASNFCYANKTIQSIVSKNAGLPELLSFVMAELEHKVAMDDFNTQSSDRGFWAFVQNMANTYGDEFSDFEKLCCSSAFKGLMCPLDNGIPELVDEGHDGTWNNARSSCPVTHNHAKSCYLLPYQAVIVVEMFPQFVLETARDEIFSSASPAGYGHSSFEDYQSSALGVNVPEQGPF